jgi:hypothetical protein
MNVVLRVLAGFIALSVPGGITVAMARDIGWKGALAVWGLILGLVAAVVVFILCIDFAVYGRLR